MSIGEKASRALEFLMGLREPIVSEALVAHGFTDADRDEGYALLNALTAGRLGTSPGAPRDASALERLDAWENLWFPIAEVTLRTRAPQVHANVFLNLRQASGDEVVVSVTTLLERIAALRTDGSAESASALGLLAKRGLDDARLAEGRALLDAAKAAIVPKPVSKVDPATVEAAEKALWTWYLEWSGIARATIHDRRALRALGFGGRREATAETAADGSAAS